MGAPFRAVAVCGPTASGKSALSIPLALALGAEVVNVDSVQMYAGLDIGSAKPPVEERGGVRHHGFDLFTPDHAATVAEFRTTARNAISDISARGQLPLLVGGSGMYFTVLLHGLAEVPATPPDVRERVAAVPLAELYAELQREDPETALRLNANDRQRVTRAIEIMRVTGTKPSIVLAEHTFTPVDVVALAIVLCRPRDELYSRINRRSEKMLADGLLAETDVLLKTYGRVAPLETLGYRQACDHIEGRLQFEHVAEEISLHTRRFAKRQMTYWRNEPTKRGWVVRPHEDEPGEEIAGFEGFSTRAQKSMKSWRAFRWSERELIEAVRQRLRNPLDRTEVWYVSPRV